MKSRMIRNATLLLLAFALGCSVASCAQRPLTPGSPTSPAASPATPATDPTALPTPQPEAPETPPEPGTGATAAPQPNISEIAAIDLPDGAVLAGDQPLSPNGRWVVVWSHTPGKDDRVIAYPATGGPGRTVATAPANLVNKGSLYVYPAGWAGDNCLVLNSQGIQADGPHKGDNGVSLRVVDLTGESAAAEVAWIPVTGDEAVQVFQAARQVFVFAGTTLWKVNLQGDGSSAELTGISLPGPEAAFEPLISPAGTHYAYYDRKTPGSAIKIFNTSAAAAGAATAGPPGGGATAVGIVKPLDLQPNEMGFRPVWSPDGRHIAFYGLHSVQATGGSPKYDVVPGEDCPAPIGDFVGVADLDGKVINRLEVQGSRIVDFEWSHDSNSILFVTVSRESSAGLDPRAFEWQSVWAGDAASTRKVCDLPSKTATWVDISPALLDSADLYLTVEQGESNSLWYAQQGLPPVEVKMPHGGRLRMTPLARAARDSVVMMIEGEHRQVVFVRQAEILKTLVDRGKTMTGNVAAYRMPCWIRDPATGKARLVVYGLAGG